MLCPHCGKGIPNDSVSCPVCNRTIRIEKPDPPKASAPAIPAPNPRPSIPSRLSAPRNTAPPVDLPDEITDLFSEWQRQKAERNFLGVVDMGLQLLFSPKLPPKAASMVRNAIAEAYALRLKPEHLEETSVAARRDLISAEIERSPKRADLYWLRGLNEGGYGIAVNRVGWDWWEPIYADIEAALDLDDTVAHYWWVRGHFVSRSDQRPPIADYAVLVEMQLSDLYKAIELDPSLAIFYADRAYIYLYHMWNFPGAEADYTKAIELERESVALAHFLAERGHMREMRSVHEYADRLSLLTGAIEDFGRAAALNPAVPSYHYQRADCCLNVALICVVQGHDNPSFAARVQTYCDLGIAESTVAIDLQPTSDHYHLRGKLRRDKGDYRGAIADFTEAIARDPMVHQQLSGCERYVERGECYVRLNDYQSAIEDFSRAIDILTELAVRDRGEVIPGDDQIDEKMADCYRMRATCYVEVGRLGDAISDLTNGLGTKRIQSSIPGQQLLYMKRRDLYEQTGNLDAAGEDMKALWMLDPLSCDFETVLFFEERKDHLSLAELYSYSIAANPDDPEMYEKRAQAYMSAVYEAYDDEDDETNMDEAYLQLALMDLNKAIELDPLKSRYYQFRASLHTVLGHKEQAQKDLQTYEELHA